MPKLPVKLTRNEIVVPPQVYQQYAERLEAMNREGMLARNMGGVAAYRANGGTVETPANTNRFLGQDVPRGSIGRLGQSLVAIGQHDFKGASDALAPREVDKAAAKAEAKDLKNKEERQQALHESIDAATNAKAYIDQGAKAVIDYRSKSWSQLLGDYSLPSLGDITNLTTAYLTSDKQSFLERKLHEKFGGTKEWNAYTLFDQEVKLLELKARSLVKGGSISDSEGEAAAKTILAGTADANTVKQQLDVVIDRNNKSLTNLGFEPYMGSGSFKTASGENYAEEPEVKTVPVTIEDPTAVKDKQMFEDSLGYSYVYDKATDTVSTEGYDPYQLYYDEGTKQFWVQGSDGYSSYVLTPVEEVNAGNKTVNKRNGGLIAY